MSMDYYPVNSLHLALAHAAYSGFPEIQYEDRDWEHFIKTKEDRNITKTRKHSERDIIVMAMFPQTWGSTALGFGGLGGQAITTAYVIILESDYGSGYCVYFGGRFAYLIKKPNDKFFYDVSRKSMADVKKAIDYETV